MDMQGTPIGKGGDGQKVTTDPRSNIPKQESTGYVDPDSLAAESAAFQAKNPGAEPSSTTDARALTSATGGIGHISSSGQAIPDFTQGGPSVSSNSGGSGSGTARSADDGGSSSIHGGAAPGYITSVVGDLSGGPKGQNLTEGLEGEAPAGLAEPGSKNDPGRRALFDAEGRNATTAGSGGPREGELSGGGPYTNLDSQKQA